MKHASLVFSLCFVGASAVAQPIYRCGAVYAQTPCPQGRAIEATDARTAAQRAEAERVAAADHRLAADMRRDRLAEGAGHPPAMAASLSGAAAPTVKPAEQHASKNSKKKRTAKKTPTTTDFVAYVPAPKKPRSSD